MSIAPIELLKKMRIGISVLFVLVAIAIWAGYQMLWTGFYEQRLWEWMELLIIPIVLGTGALLFRREESKVERETALDKQRQDTLMIFLDRMENLLLIHSLRKSGENSEVRIVAKARTLAVLQNLDGLRKCYALQFLYESGLISEENRVVDLAGALLRNAQLKGAQLKGSNLGRTHLEGANLQGASLQNTYLGMAQLQGANLECASLEGANLEAADLGGANLYLAILKNANLMGAWLGGANLEGADLTGARLEPMQLDDVKKLSDAIMPDGTKYEHWISKGKPNWM